MKCILVNPSAPTLMVPPSLEVCRPPKTWAPLGIAYLASALRASGITADYKDLHDSGWEDVKSFFSSVAPDLVGISCLTHGRAHALKTAEIVKKVDPSIMVIMGGPHATFFPEQILSVNAVDMVVIGEGEETLVELMQCLVSHGDLQAVRGIAYRKGGRICRTPPRPRIKDLDTLAFPAYDAFDIHQYKSPEIPRAYLELPGTHMITSRGCPFSCKFCSVNTFFGKKWIGRSPQNVLEELEQLIDRYGIEHIYFSDDLFTLDHNRTVSICKEIINHQIQLLWMAETRVDCVNQEMLAWMRKAGCYRIYYGVESGSPTILKIIDKGFSVEQIREAFEMTHNAGIEPCCFLMVGNPGETPETIDETIALIQEIRPAKVPIIGITLILPGNPLYEISKKKGIITDDYWVSEDPPPLYTGDHDVDDLIYLQLHLVKGIYPPMYEHLRALGFDDDYFRMRKLLGKGVSGKKAQENIRA